MTENERFDMNSPHVKHDKYTFTFNFCIKFYFYLVADRLHIFEFPLNRM